MLRTARKALKYYLALGGCTVVALCTVYVTRPTAQSNASPIYGVTIPDGYRDWKLIAVKPACGRQGRPVARLTRQRDSD